MPEIQNPIGLRQSVELFRSSYRDEGFDAATATIGAYLISRAAYLTVPDDRRPEYLPPDEMEELGFPNAPPRALVEGGRVNLEEVRGAQDEDFIAEERDRPDHDRLLAEAIMAAEETRSPEDILGAIKIGLSSPDDLIRICALSSAMKLFTISSLGILPRISHFISVWDDLDIVAQEIFLALFPSISRSLGLSSRSGSAGRIGGDPGGVAAVSNRSNGVTLIHGTHFDVNPDPVWYHPHIGDLHNHIRSFRTDIYSGGNFFDWEGRWSDRGRYVAAKNLRNWVELHGFSGSDIVCHSHGGNVVISSTRLGVKYDRVVFLSCPVHWPKYSFSRAEISKAHLVRVRFDKVVFADGGAQRFPPGTVEQEMTVGGWFGTHGMTKESRTWSQHHVDRLLI
ncbi:hypothetical protein ACRDNQ_10100 [Palleronia sp. KMU-117]|uniref:hypothetical protein n=1 Tax=Palleronia sp. KMU-117 TaxID=3434108 RepID=UPI003D76661D